jgi:hypothetical protein
MQAINEFKDRLRREWLIPFCNKHGYSDEGFVVSSIDKVAETDARDFLTAIDDGLVVHDNGVFTAPCSKATEQIFWQGEKTTSPRRITLWIEPIITIAGLSKLHRNFMWPKNQLGLQSKTWAFDLVAYSSNLTREMVACEVKKSWSEIEKLILFMEKHKSSPEDGIINIKGSERNALKKVIGLRLCRAPKFWALGPDGKYRIFEVEYEANNCVALRPTTEKALIYDGA